MRNLCLYLALFSFAATPITLFSASADINPVKIEIINEEDTVQPGTPFWIALHFAINDGWHSYWKNPGDSGAPPNISWQLPAGYEVLKLEWPTPEKFTVDSLVGYGYEGETYLLAQIKPSDSVPVNTMADIAAKIKWLVCNDSTCLPGSSTASLSISVKAEAPKINESSSAQFIKARANLPTHLPNSGALLKEGNIHINLSMPNAIKDNNYKVQFFPAHEELIDISKLPELTKESNSTTNYKLTLKSALNSENSLNTLEGILVISDANKEQLFAYEILAPITNHNAEVAMLDEAGITAPMLAASSSEFDGGIAWAVLLAFVGGLLLNLMPCVLPVMSFKILAFVKMAGQDRWLTLKHGLAFGAGVLVSFWTLAGAMLALQSYGQSVGWGFQLQDPLFVAILAAFLFIFSLSLFGLFEFGTSIASIAGQAQVGTAAKKSGFTSSFFSGVLATAIATPCTGPFLGSAVGFAVTLPVIWAMVIFTSLGLGMALPYVALSAFPSLLSFLPKPGNWMIIFKEIVAFLVLATVLWLLWVFGAETDAHALTMILGSFLFFALGGWIYGKWGSPVAKKSTRMVSYAFVAACFAFGAYGISLATTAEHSETTTNNREVADGWETFSPARVEELRKQGTPVLIDFTAKWCLICQTNHVALSSDTASKALSEAGVVKMKADWTKSDPVITEELKKFGRNSVPLYVLYSADPTQPPKILPQILTPDIITEHLDNAEIAEK